MVIAMKKSRFVCSNITRQTENASSWLHFPFWNCFQQKGQRPLPKSKQMNSLKNGRHKRNVRFRQVHTSADHEAATEKNDFYKCGDTNDSGFCNRKCEDMHSRNSTFSSLKEFLLFYHNNYSGATFCHNTNEIQTTKYTMLTFIPKNLYEQFQRWANFYFLALIILNWLPFLNAFGKEVCMIPLIVVLAVLGLKDAVEDVQRYRMDCRINGQPVQAFC